MCLAYSRHTQVSSLIHIATNRRIWWFLQRPQGMWTTLSLSIHHWWTLCSHFTVIVLSKQKMQMYLQGIESTSLRHMPHNRTARSLGTCFYLFLVYVYMYIAYIYVCLPRVYLVLLEVRRRDWIPVTRVMYDSELPRGCWEPNAGALEEQSVPLTATSPAPCVISLWLPEERLGFHLDQKCCSSFLSTLPGTCYPLSFWSQLFLLEVISHYVLNWCLPSY